MIPDTQTVDEHLLYILGRGSVNLGSSANTERLMLMMTRSCHLRCSYCFVQKKESDTTLSEALAKKAIDWLMSSQRSHLEVQFFGGEPTAEWNRLCAAIEYATHHPQRGNRQLELILTTNGMGLTQAHTRYLSEAKVRVLFSLDGPEYSHQRFRAPYQGEDASWSLNHEEAWQGIESAIDLLNSHEVQWFMNAVVPPADASGVLERYLWAIQNNIPALQLNYAVGMAWPVAKMNKYLSGMVEAMRHHRKHQPDLVLYNWQSECEPVMLSDDIIVDVDGTVLHDGAIFLERAFPELQKTYFRGHLEDLNDFDATRWSLARLCDVMLQTYPQGSSQRQVILQNIRMGAAVDWVIQRLREET